MLMALRTYGRTADRTFNNPSTSVLDPIAVRRRPDRPDAAATAVHSAPTRFGPHNRASVRSRCLYFGQQVRLTGQATALWSSRLQRVGLRHLILRSRDFYRYVSLGLLPALRK